MKAEIYDFLIKEIEKNYLLRYKETLYKYINSEKFQSKLDNYLKDRDFSVFSLFDLFIDYFNQYDSGSSRDYIVQIFNWLNNKSFPHKGINEFNFDLVPIYEFFLKVLNYSLDKIESTDNSDFTNKYPLTFLTSEEELMNNITQEYFTFKDVFYNCYIKELMYLDMAITGHNTIHHVIGVNYLSMYIARQLNSLGLPVDLGVVAGTSLGHDIGKYGVLKDEINRVPYLHYYYTEEWFKRFNMDKIGHIATNHSTWDLELENLSIESLILIYSDFRVKNKVENNVYKMYIFSLEDSFDVILDKLDNVDAAKENRYKKVYKKLKDFEDYIISLGVDTTLNNELIQLQKKPFELMNKKEVLDNIKYISIEHNIYLMSKLTDSSSFNAIIEMARGETNWRKLRLYLQIFKEYSIYLTQEQKTTTLHFLWDLLLHTGEDIRKEAAELIGRLIALFDEEYRKELPSSVKSYETKKSSEILLDEFLNKLLYPDHKVADSQREWLYNLKNIIKSLFEVSHGSNYNKYFDVLNKYYHNYNDLSIAAQFYLSQTINYIPIKALDNNRLLKLYTYILKQLDSDNIEIRLSTLDIIYEILNTTNNIMFIASIRNWIIANLQKSSIPADNYLKYIIGMKINISPNYQEILDSNYAENQNDTSEIFLENLKTATEWVKKKVNIDILYDQVVKNPKGKGLHTAMHLCNILKVSAIERIRNYSGETLLNIFHLLSPEEKNDVAVELLRALEMDNYQFTKFIPYYLGQLLLYLPPNELDEIIDDFEDKIKTVSSRVVFLLLNTIVISIENYGEYIKRFEEEQEIYYKRRDRLLGLLSIAMASYDKDIKNESLMILSSNLFESKTLSLDEKFNIFDRIGKKILTLLYTDKEDDFLFYSNAASLNHIYRFISLYEFYHKDLVKINKQKIAFFPGSFDPFSLGHKEIAIEIREQGFQVYLAVDEFSWSKRTEPHIFRRNIINMSIASENDIYLFPKDIPINISNPNDLYKLKELFPSDDVYIVVGSDVLVNASAYKIESPILDFPHIIFDRKSSISKDDDEKKLEESIENIRANIIRLSLPPQYEDISSSQIRKNIDLNRDISKFIDPLAESYIYDYGLYLREPQYKTLLQSKTLEVNVSRNLSEKLLNEIKEQFGELINIKHLESLRNKLSYRILLVREANSHELLGFSTFYWIRQSILYDEFNNSSITEYIRQSVKGRIVLISGVCVKNNSDYLIETVLNETLSVAINRDYNYAIYNNSLTKEINPKVEKQLLLQGFAMTDFIYNNSPIFMVNMNNPITLNLDLENMLKPPYSTNLKVLETIRDTRIRLKEALVNLYPGELLLTYNRDMTYSKLIQKICDTNGVSIIQSSRRILGPNMCVPFGSILNSSIVPNTVTKTMHTEKVFKSNIIDFNIEAYPHYLNLAEQAKILKSFNRPVILVDDLLHKGYRINVIEPILKSMGIEIKKVILGILSGRGSEIGKEKNLPLDYAYFIPNLKLWFNESSQYPFIGGDMVDKTILQSSSIPSINMILPYVAPKFIKNTKNDAIYNLSEICLKNSFMIFKSIEEVYQSINQKSLNIKGLDEIIVSPRHPDTRNINSTRNIKPSACIDMDLEYLMRLENIIRR